MFVAVCIALGLVAGVFSVAMVLIIKAFNSFCHEDEDSYREGQMF